MNQRKSQCKRLLEYLSSHDGVTQFEAISELGILRLASRISELKKFGCDIGSDFVNVTNRYGEKCRVKKYYWRSDDLSQNAECLQRQ